LDPFEGTAAVDIFWSICVQEDLRAMPPGDVSALFASLSAAAKYGLDMMFREMLRRNLPEASGGGPLERLIIDALDSSLGVMDVVLHLLVNVIGRHRLMCQGEILLMLCERLVIIGTQNPPFEIVLGIISVLRKIVECPSNTSAEGGWSEVIDVIIRLAQEFCRRSDTFITQIHREAWDTITASVEYAPGTCRVFFEKMTGEQIEEVTNLPLSDENWVMKQSETLHFIRAAFCRFRTEFHALAPVAATAMFEVMEHWRPAVWDDALYGLIAVMGSLGLDCADLCRGERFAQLVEAEIGSGSPDIIAGTVHALAFLYEDMLKEGQAHTPESEHLLARLPETFHLITTQLKNENFDEVHICVVLGALAKVVEACKMEIGPGERACLCQVFEQGFAVITWTDGDDASVSNALGQFAVVMSGFTALIKGLGGRPVSEVERDPMLQKPFKRFLMNRVLLAFSRLPRFTSSALKAFCDLMAAWNATYGKKENVLINVSSNWAVLARARGAEDRVLRQLAAECIAWLKDV
jgi:hypothetical protein